MLASGTAAVRSRVRAGACVRAAGTTPDTLKAVLQQKAFWRGMYRGGEDVFTLQDVNENLLAHFPTLRRAMPEGGGASAPRVLVPLCGRDISVAWLARQGVGVVGVDFVDEPIRQLGEEVGGLVPLVDDFPRLGAYQAGSRTLKALFLLHGDFFDLTEGDYGGRFEGVWDRAALTAVAPHLRGAYVLKLYQLLVEGGAVLLEALVSNVPMDGAMGEGQTVEVLREGGFTVTVLQETDVRGAYPSFTPPGLTYLKEQVLLATKTSADRTDGRIAMR